MRQRKSIITLMTLTIAAITAIAPPVLADSDGREYQVKAAYLYNFAQFVEWPDGAFASGDSPLVFGVLGQNPFGDALDRSVRGKAIGGHPLVVEYYPRLESMGACHLLFVSQSENQNLPAVFHELNGKPVVTVGETGEFPWAGGMIRFYNDGNKVRFEINVQAAENSRLKLSSKLLNLARIFKKG